MVKVTLYGGVNEIGGNKVFLEDGDHRLLLDFGMSFGKKGLYFEEYLKPRVANGFGDLVEMGLLPSPELEDFEGVYRPDYLRIAGLESDQERSIDGVLLSHFHYDHSAYISFLREDIPIYCSETTKAIAKAISESSSRDFETEVYDFKTRPIFNPRDSANPRTIQAINSGQKFRVNGLEILPFEVDHSIPGGMAYIIYTSGGNLLYTGDLRLQGPAGDKTTLMMERAKEEGIDWIICEGTRIDSSETRTEEDVERDCNETLPDFSGLAVADFAFKDSNRFDTIHKVAKTNGRKLVISFQGAHLLRELRRIGLDVPDPTNDDIFLYQEKKGTGTFREQDYSLWEREYLNWNNARKPEEIKEIQNEVIVHLDFFRIKWFIDLKPVEGSVYIHSSSEAYNEEQVIDEKRLNNWLDHFGLSKFHFHASGHANQNDLRKVVETISPSRFLIPIHTEHPHLFESIWPEVKHPDDDGVVQLQ